MSNDPILLAPHRNSPIAPNPDLFDHRMLFSSASKLLATALQGIPARGQPLNGGKIARLQAAMRCAEDCQRNGFHRLAAEVIVHYFGGLI